MIRERLAQADAAKGFILDGFPRNIAQAEALETLLAGLGKPLEAVVLLNLDLGILFKRLTGRRICQTCGQVFNIFTSPPDTAAHRQKCGHEPVLIQRPDDKEADQAAHQVLHRGEAVAGGGRGCRDGRGVQEHSGRGAGRAGQRGVAASLQRPRARLKVKAR